MTVGLIIDEFDPSEKLEQINIDAAEDGIRVGHPSTG